MIRLESGMMIRLASKDPGEKSPKRPIPAGVLARNAVQPAATELASQRPRLSITLCHQRQLEGGSIANGFQRASQRSPSGTPIAISAVTTAYDIWNPVLNNCNGSNSSVAMAEAASAARGLPGRRNTFDPSRNAIIRNARIAGELPPVTCTYNQSTGSAM